MIPTRTLSRSKEIVLSLAMLDYLTADQIRRIHRLGGDRNTRRVLFDLEKKGLVSSYRLERYKIYHLAKRGRDMAGTDKVRKPTIHAAHFLLRNEAYIHFRPVRWQPEPTITWGSHTIRPDAIFYTKEGRRYILEVDVSQPMVENKEKIELYKRMNARKVLYVTTSDYRKKVLAELLAPLGGKALTVDDLK